MSSDTRCLESEPFLAMFALEFIKNEVLLESYFTFTKKHNGYRKLDAITELARKLGIDDVQTTMSMCVKLRSVLMIKLRHLLRQCHYRRWPLDHCLILAPNWLRIVESKVHLMPRVIKFTKIRPLPLKLLAKASVFYFKLVENVYKVAKNGESIYSDRVACSVASYYGARSNLILAIWKRTCELVKWTIVNNSDSVDFFPYYNVNCHITDCLLLHDSSFRVVTLGSFCNEKQLRDLLKLYELINKYNVETLLRNRSPDLVVAWLKLYAVYSCQGKTSLLYLQRCWYELKLEARTRLLSYWRGEEDSVPHSLLLSILSNFRYINLEPFPDWTEFVKMGLVVVLKDVAKQVCDQALFEAAKDYDMDDYICMGMGMGKEIDCNVDGYSKLIAGTSNDISTTNAENNLNNKTIVNTSLAPNEEEDIPFETNKASAERESRDKLNINDDCKWLVDISIPLVRCNLTAAWKKYYRNGVMNVGKIALEELLPKDLVKINRIHESAAKSMNSNSDHSLMVLQTNPDFNLKLKRLSRKFLKSKHNRRLLSLCKPVAVVLDRTDMDSMAEGPAPLRKAKKVELSDIDEVRKINSTILTAEVAPVVVHSPIQVPQITSCASPSEGHGTATSDEIPDLVKKFMGLCEYKPEITEAQLEKVLNEMWAKSDKTTLVLKDVNKSKAEWNVSLCRCGSIQVEAQKPHETQPLDEIRQRNMQESKEIAFSVMFITRKKHLSPKKDSNTKDKVNSEQAIVDNDITMSSSSSTSDDCLIIDETEKRSKETENEMKTKRRRNRKVKCKEKKPENMSKTKKVKSKETEEKDQKCLNAYDEWTRQKNLALKYFSLPSFIKPNDKEDRTDKTDKINANISGPKDLVCPNVIKASYKMSSAAERNLPRNINITSDVIQTVKPKPLEAFCDPAKRASNQTNDAAQAPVIDLTETSDDKEPTSETPATIIRAIHFSNANITAACSIIQRANKESEAPDARTTSSCEKQTLPGDNRLPIITDVCSLANSGLAKDNIVTKRTTTARKKQHDPQKNNPPRKPIPIEPKVPSVPPSQTSPENLIWLAPVQAPLTTNVLNTTLPTVTVFPMLETPGVQSPWLPLPAMNSNTSMSQKSFQRIFSSSPPNKEKSSSDTRRGQNLAQVRTISTEAGRYFVLVPESMLHDVPKTTEFLVKKGLPSSTTLFVPVSAEESSKQMSAFVDTLQSNGSGRCDLPTVVVSNTTQTNAPKNFCLLVETWIQGKAADELKILRVDGSRPHWTPRVGYLLITDSDLVCEMPTYWSVEPPEYRSRILFPAENNGSTIYNPKTVKVSNSVALGTTAFAKWVRSVLELNMRKTVDLGDGTCDKQATVADVVNAAAHLTVTASMWSEPAHGIRERKAEATNETVPGNPIQYNGAPLTPTNGGAKSAARLKVKSFARIRDDEYGDYMIPPQRVCLQGKIYQKVSDEPLKYAQVLTMVSSLQETRCLSTQNAMFYILPNDTQAVCEQAQG